MKRKWHFKHERRLDLRPLLAFIAGALLVAFIPCDTLCGDAPYQLVGWLPACTDVPSEPFAQFEILPDGTFRTRQTNCQTVSPTRDFKVGVPIPDIDAGTGLLVGALALGYLGVRRAER